MSGEVGATLREARAARGVELEEIERVTKIRARYLSALEAERWDVLPGRAYARGFLRTYAEFLEVDPSPLVEELDRDLAAEEHAEEVPPEPLIQRGTLPTGLRARGWRRLAAVVVGAAAVAAVVAVIVTAGGEGNDADTPNARPPVDEEVEAPPEPEPEETTPEPSRVSLRLVALGTVWACVVDGRGEALVNSETLTEGEDRGPFEARRLLMTFGNGQIEITADDEPVEVTEAGEPIGFEVTAAGVEELPVEDRPTCT